MATCLVCGAGEHDWEHPAAIRNVSTPEDVARNEIRLLVNWQGDEGPVTPERLPVVIESDPDILDDCGDVSPLRPLWDALRRWKAR